MSALHLIRHALSLSPRVVLGKALALVGRQMGGRLRAMAAARRCSYPPAGGRLGFRLAGLDLSGVAALAPVLERVVPLYLDHRFDLLGSGWVRVAHGETYAGFGPWRTGPGAPLPATGWAAAVAAEHHPADRARAAAILALIDDPHWRPIDWHVDFISGYRWSPATYGPAVPLAHRPGVDVKLPWELARLQHLPHLACAHALGFEGAGREFRNQVLDFLGANPRAGG